MSKYKIGDTIKINSDKIRLFGIDAPEQKQLCNKTYLPVNIYKYMLNDDTHIKDNEEKKLICKVRHDIKTNDVIFELQDYL